MCSHRVLTGISLSLKASLSYRPKGLIFSCMLVFIRCSLTHLNLCGFNPTYCPMIVIQSLILISLPSLERIKLRIQPKGFTQTLDHDCYMIGSLNVLDIVCYIQEAYRSAQHFVLGIRSQVSSLRRKVAKCIMRYLVLIGVLIGMYVDQRSRSYRSVM